MNFLELAKQRHAIRKYQPRQITREELDYVIEAGLYAPNAGGGQRSMICAIYDAELCERVGRLNLMKFDRSHLIGSFVSKEQPSNIDDPTIENGFYGAPCVCVIFGERNFLYNTADAFCCAENMVLAATELGLGSCTVARGEETFADPEGEALLREWGIPENYVAQCFVPLGYIDGEPPHTKPRRHDRVKVIE